MYHFLSDTSFNSLSLSLYLVRGEKKVHSHPLIYFGHAEINVSGSLREEKISENFELEICLLAKFSVRTKFPFLKLLRNIYIFHG